MPLQLTVVSIDIDSDSTPAIRRYNKDELVVGSSPGSDLVLNQHDISGQHLKLRVARDNGKERLLVTDLGSLTGTKVENLALPPRVEREVSAHERIMVGEFLIKAKILEAEPLVHGDEAAVFSQHGSNGRRHHEKEPRAAESVNKDLTKKQKTEEMQNTAKKEAPQSTEISRQPIEEETAKKRPALVQPAAETAALEQFIISGQVDPENPPRLKIEAIQLFVIRGAVTYQGKPLAGVKIDCGIIGQTETDAAGSFAFHNIEEETDYLIKPSKAGFVFRSEQFNGRLTGDTTVKIEANKVYDIKGVVTYKGKPLCEVEIDAGPLGSVYTDYRGTFIFSEVEEGTHYGIQAKKQDYRFMGKDADGLVNGNVTVEFQGTKLLTLEGVVMHRGTPLPGVEVDAGLLGKTTSDGEGRYRFFNVPEGTAYTIAIAKQGFRFR